MQTTSHPSLLCFLYLHRQPMTCYNRFRAMITTLPASSRKKTAFEPFSISSAVAKTTATTAQIFNPHALYFLPLQFFSCTLLKLVSSYNQYWCRQALQLLQVIAQRLQATFQVEAKLLAVSDKLLHRQVNVSGSGFIGIFQQLWKKLGQELCQKIILSVRSGLTMNTGACVFKPTAKQAGSQCQARLLRLTLSLCSGSFNSHLKAFSGVLRCH